MSMPRKKKRKRRRWRLTLPSRNPEYLKTHPEAARKKKHRRRYRLTWKAWVLIGSVCALALALIVPIVADDSKLKGLGYSSAAIKAIRKDKLTKTILDNKWYSEYLSTSLAKGEANLSYLQLYTAVTPAHEDVITSLDDTDFLLYSRLIDRGYTAVQAVRLFGSLHRWEITPLLVFDYQANDQAYIDDCVSHRDTNSQDHFELSGTYYTYYENTQPVSDPGGLDMLVNKTWYLDSSYAPPEVTDIDARYAAAGRQLASAAADAFVTWSKAGADVGVTFYAASAYRDYASQESLYNSYLKTLGQAATDAASARPGFSEHQSGYAVDIAATNEDDTPEYKDTRAYQWTSTNCMDYGWILRYPEGKQQITGYEFESWHYRYVGVALAQAVASSHLTFDEFWCLYLKGWDDPANQPSQEILNATDYHNQSASASASPAASSAASSAASATAAPAAKSSASASAAG
jgi:LAS superfamily LD-carboxypeptidase LdcB